VVIDASFFYPHHRRIFRVLAEAAGVPFVGIWLGETGEMQPTADEPVANDWPAVALDNPENAASAARKLTGLFG
jgi:predicted kinase